MRKALLTAFLFLFTSVSVAALDGIIIIDDDYGGTVVTYVSWWNRIRDSGIPVHFRGMCISACTLGLSLPKEQLCVEPTSLFGFHLASRGETADKDFTEAMIRRYYPPAVQEWLKNRKLTLENIIFMNADEVVALGIMSRCELLPS